MGLVIQQTTVANTVIAINNLEKLQEICRRWHSDTNEKDSVWLEWNADGESAKRSLVYDIRLTYPSGPVVSPFGRYKTLTARLSLNRHPLWESAPPVSGYAIGAVGSQVSALGGKQELATTYGTVPGRIAKTNIFCGGTPTDVFSNIWLGIRDPYHGYTNFQSLYECETGAMGTDTAVDTTAACSPVGSVADNVAFCNFATVTTLAKRVSIQITTTLGGANLQYQAGTYVVLLRCELSEAGTLGLQLRYGINGAPDADFIQCEEVYATNEDAHFVELGEVTIPPQGSRYEYYTTTFGGSASWIQSIRYTEFQIWAEQITNTPEIDFDCIVLIPARHYLKFQDISLPEDSTAWFYCHEDDTNTACIESPLGTKMPSAEFVARDWYMPNNGALVVVAAERSTGQFIADAVYGGFEVFHRWLSYRGA
jgi:hypothetical protein